MSIADPWWNMNYDQEPPDPRSKYILVVFIGIAAALCFVDLMWGPL